MWGFQDIYYNNNIIIAHVFNRIKVTDIHNLNSKCQYVPKLMGNRDLLMDFHFILEGKNEYV